MSGIQQGLISSYKVSGIPTSGLIAEWLLGSDANDTGGGGYNGTVVGTVTYDGTSANFNNAGYITTTFTGLNSGDCTVSVWVNYNATGDQALYGSSSANWGGIRTDNSTYLQLSIWGTGQNYTTTTTTGVWYHLLVTKSGNNYNLYENNSDRGTKTDTNAFSNGNFQIGNAVNGAVKLKGKLQKLRVYNRVLTGAEITTLYNGGTPI